MRRLDRPYRSVAPIFGELAIDIATTQLIATATTDVLAALDVLRPAAGVFFPDMVFLLGISTVMVARFLFARPSD